MTNKERKNLKHSLKTEVDRSEKWILLALTGEALGAKEDPATSQTREVIIPHLKEVRANIQDKTQRYLEVIDDAINKIS